MKRALSLICAILYVLTASAQDVDDYRLYKMDAQQISVEPIVTDTLLFYRAMHSQRDLYEQVTAYRFSFVEYARRGFYFTERAASLDGVDVRHLNISILRRLSLNERAYAGVAHSRNNISLMAGEDEFSTVDGVPTDDGAITMDDMLNQQLIEELRQVDLNTLSPFECMSLMFEWKKRYR